MGMVISRGNVNKGYERGYTPVTPCEGKVGMVRNSVNTDTGGMSEAELQLPC